jgi:hypothetical protein
MQDKQYDRDHEEHPRDLGCDSGDTAQTELAGDEPHDQKNERVVKHDLLLAAFTRILFL